MAGYGANDKMVAKGGYGANDTLAPRGIGQRLYDNIIGDPNDGVQSTGEALGTWLNRAGESATLGVVGDEASAAAYGALPGRTYDAELARMRGNEDAMSTAGQISADLTGAIAPALTGLGLMRGAVSLPAAMRRGAGFGMAGGATQGFAEGEGGLDNRMMSGGAGALIGGALGGAIPVAGEAGRQVYRGVSNSIRDSRVSGALGQQLGVSPDAGRMIATVMGQENPQAMQDALQRLGPNAMLADASPQAAGALDASMRSVVPQAGEALRRVDDRAARSYTGVMDAINPFQGPRQGLQGQMHNIRTETAQPRSAAYDAAYSKPINYAEKTGQELLGLAQRVPREAINNANRLMQLNGERSPQIIANIGDDGAVTFTNPPDVRQWDYITRGLRQMAESGEGAGALGGQTQLGSAYERLSGGIRDRLKEAVPEYGDALNTARDAIQRVQGVKLGSELISPRTTTEEALQRIANATAPEKEAIRTGVRTQIEEALGNLRAVASDQNIDARQAASAFSQLSSPNVQTKLAALFDEDWPAIKQQLDFAGSAVGLRAQTAANSRTAPRQAFDAALREQTAPSPIMQGRPLAAASEAIGGLTGTSRAAVSRLNDEVKGEIADVLTREGSAVKSLNDIMRTLSSNRINPQAGNNIRGLLQAGGFGALPAATSGLTSLLGLPQ